MAEIIQLCPMLRPTYTKATNLPQRMVVNVEQRHCISKYVRNDEVTERRSYGNCLVELYTTRKKKSKNQNLKKKTQRRRSEKRYVTERKIGIVPASKRSNL